MKLSDYVEKFKELITKCDISGSAALHMFTNGLNAEECKDCMMQKPKDLDAFYDAAINLENIETRTNILNPSFGSGSRSEWDMQVDRAHVTRINAMTIPERERHFADGLCFICHKKGHMSGECPERKNKKKHHKGKFKGKKGRRFTRDRHVRATKMDDDDSGSEEEEVQESKPVQRGDRMKTICALMKGLSINECDALMMDMVNKEEDF